MVPYVDAVTVMRVYVLRECDGDGWGRCGCSEYMGGTCGSGVSSTMCQR